MSKRMQQAQIKYRFKGDKNWRVTFCPSYEAVQKMSDLQAQGAKIRYVGGAK